jgi:nucleosome binding factor SPN SPT16 subunit
VKGRRPVKLPKVFVRPALDGKRLPGEVEIHQNGLRYQSPLGSQRVGSLSCSDFIDVIGSRCVQISSSAT